MTDEIPLKIKQELKELKASEAKIKKVIEEYKEAKVSPGECVGLISAESIGEPGTQMCVSGNEKVILKLKNKIRIVKIGEFVDKVFERVKTRINNNYEIYNIPDELLVLGLDKNEKLKWSRVLALNRIKSSKKLINIKTRSGRSIIATDFHSFVTRKNNEVVSIAGKDLNVGDRIPVMRYLPENCISCIAVNDYISSVNEQKGMLISSKGKAKSIPNLIELNESFGWFIGAYLAEGNATNGQVSISNINEAYMSNAKKFINNLGLDYREYWGNRGFALGRDLKVSSTLFANFIRSICNTGSKNKKVPDFAYSAKEDFVRGLLRGYFDGDGNFNVKRKMIRVSSNSEEMIRGIALLLTRFKILARIFKDKKGQFWLYIPYNYAELFLNKISSDIPKKKQRLIELAKLVKEREIKSLDQVEMISGFGDLFYKTAKKLGMRTRYINNFTKRQRIGRTALFRYIKKFEILAKEKDVDIKDELRIMRRMFNSDVIWDAIRKIEYVEHGEPYVYDLTVPGLETFTTFEGIVTHNTLNTFHFAGVAEMNITMGLPRIIEILDGRKKITTPMMEIYLKSPYNKGKDIRVIASSIKETLLKEVVKEFSINIAEYTIELKMNKEKMKVIGVNDAIIMKAISKSTKGLKIKKKEDSILIKVKTKEESLNAIYRVKEKIKDIYIKGVKGIKQVLPVKRGDEFIIITAGSNLKDILEIDQVDSTRTTTNNVYEISNVLGIEAARQAVMNEVYKVIESQGLNVDIRHIMLVADTMCFSGAIKGITRYGVVSEKASVLARASFETPINHIINASLIGEVDNLNSVVENVMLNQPVPVGTGLPGLVVKVRK